MKLGEIFRELEQKRLDDLKARHLRCSLCNLEGDVDWYSRDRAGNYHLASTSHSKTAKRYLLCVGCASLSPSLSPSLSRKEVTSLQIREAMASKCFTSDLKISPDASAEHFVYLPHWWPAWYLGENNLSGGLLTCIQIQNAFVLKFVPDHGQNEIMDSHVSDYGCIFTTFPLWHWIDEQHLPQHVTFTRSSDVNGKRWTTIVKG
jgi:hypothetical protein